MDVAPLTALLWVRGREPGKGREVLTAILMILAFILGTGTFLVGRGFARTLSSPGSTGAQLPVLTGLLALAGASALWHGSRSLDPRILEAFQVAPVPLFLAELATALTTPFKRAGAFVLMAFFLGAGTVHLRLLAWMLPLGCLWLLSLVSLERILGRGTRILGAQGRLSLVFSLLLLALPPLLNGISATLLARPLLPQRSLSLAILSRPALPIPPVTLAWTPGEPLARRIAQGLVLPFMGTAFLLILCFFALRQEGVGRGPHRSTSPLGVWASGRPWVTIAHDHWNRLWSSRQGSFYLFTPLLAPLIQVDLMIFHQVPGVRVLIGVAGWVMLPLGTLCCSFFGLDRGAVRSFWTWPITDRDLLLGKLVGTAAYQGVVILLLVGVMALATPMPARFLPATLLFCLSLASCQLAAGLKLSILHPRRLDPTALNAGAFDDAHLARLGHLLQPWLLLVLVGSLAALAGPLVLTLTLFVILGLSLRILARAMPRAVTLLETHRDELSAHLEREAI
nr:hypothetical protein [uncultured Holophaga sp.]